MKTIHLMSGLPGSGKSYYLEHYVCEDSFNRILHRDDVRAQLREHYNKPDEYFPCSAEEEYDAWITACVSVIIAHPDAYHYYFDQTTLGNNAAAKFYNALALALDRIGIDICDYMFIIEVICTNIEVCAERNSHREGFARVPDDVFWRMAAAPQLDRAIRQKLHAPHPRNPMYICIHRIYGREDKMEMV